MNHALTAHSPKLAHSWGRKRAFIRHEKTVQTARLFCIRIFLVANKPSISHFVKNEQTTDSQLLAQNHPFLVPQKPPKTPKKAT